MAAAPTLPHMPWCCAVVNVLTTGQYQEDMIPTVCGVGKACVDVCRGSSAVQLYLCFVHPCVLHLHHHLTHSSPLSSILLASVCSAAPCCCPSSRSQVGFNMKKVTKGSVVIKMWDLGGQVSFLGCAERLRV